MREKPEGHDWHGAAASGFMVPVATAFETRADGALGPQTTERYRTRTSGLAVVPARTR